MRKNNITPEHIANAFDNLDVCELVDVFNEYQRKTNSEHPFIIHANTAEEINEQYKDSKPYSIILGVLSSSYNTGAEYFARRDDDTIVSYTSDAIRSTVFDYSRISQYIFENGDPLGNDYIEKLITVDIREEVERIIDEIEGDGELLELYEEYTNATGNGEPIYYMSDFNYKMRDYDLLEVAEMASRGSFDSYHDYFMIEDGELTSFDCLDDYVDKNDIADYVTEYKDGLGFSDLEELFEE